MHKFLLNEVQKNATEKRLELVKIITRINLPKKHTDKSPRELLHAAVTINHEVTNIFTLDGSDFSDIGKIRALKLKYLFAADELLAVRVSYNHIQ